jgi:hypothetical protein
LCPSQSLKRAFNDTWVFSVATNEWTELLPAGGAVAARFGHSAHLLTLPDTSTAMVVFGGATDAGSAVLSDLNALSLGPQSPTWRTVTATGPSPGPRYAHVSALVGTALYVTGGFAVIGTGDLGALSLSEVWVATFAGSAVAGDTVSATWTQLPPLSPAPANRGGVAFVQRSPLVFLAVGGWNGVDPVTPNTSSSAVLLSPAGGAEGSRRARRDITPASVYPATAANDSWVFDLTSGSPVWSLLSATGPAGAADGTPAVAFASAVAGPGNTVLVLGGTRYPQVCVCCLCVCVCLVFFFP